MSDRGGSDRAGRDALRDRLYGHYLSSRVGERAVDLKTEIARSRAFVGRLVERHVPSDRRITVLDLGCGPGLILHELQQRGYGLLSGVDRSTEQIAAGRAFGIKGLEEGDLFAYLDGRAASSFDLVITYDVMEHLDDGELLQLVDGVHRALKPGGRWIIHVPNGESPFCGRSRYGDLTHERAFTAGSLGQLLRASGFSAVTCYEDEPASHGLKSMVRSWLWRPIRLALRFYLAVETGSIGRDAIFSQNMLAVAVK